MFLLFKYTLKSSDQRDNNYRITDSTNGNGNIFWINTYNVTVYNAD